MALVNYWEVYSNVYSLHYQKQFYVSVYQCSILVVLDSQRPPFFLSNFGTQLLPSSSRGENYHFCGYQKIYVCVCVCVF